MYHLSEDPVGVALPVARLKLEGRLARLAVRRNGGTVPIGRVKQLPTLIAPEWASGVDIATIRISLTGLPVHFTLDARNPAPGGRG